MSPNVTRRRALGAVGSVGVAALARCLGGMPTDAVVATDPVDYDRSARVVRYADLPAAERTIASDALDDGLYHACPELPDALRSFAGRVSGPEKCHLERDGDYFGLWVRIEDGVYAGSADPPEETPSCGVL